ncbi:hypothetical protein DY120_00325 [Apilactobacillus micheneri]|uniref:Uncharacterized protein n=1 Tax=Apilactobacillus micheneri TaxID=1899430 RepID=A0ABY2YYN7_9LACO|nr:hypothetical protein [Apilactobacillus micheneri]TPR26177.1 hypothetical protein DY114_00325 [Apilactobacillus micheneri]TPR26931.1 hypothetical protein DY111_00325 [Apilactobacillus micheneri]TPR27789.1 hypothetical protein DY113_04100 [Apilactobacillus micheneri]TPR31694.1 hypothetical protein DY117_00325 [Apilactobacillus micheneri]TPR32098.1 hypothetical protein DY120_00325 [Apilactobacillus micheneri]
MKFQKTILGTVAVLIIAVGGGVAFNNFSNHTDKADTLTNTSNNLMKRISENDQYQKSLKNHKKKTDSYDNAATQSGNDVNKKPVYKPITKDYLGNWYKGLNAKMIIQNNMFMADHPTDPVAGMPPLNMERYGKTNAIFIRSVYKINTYWPATITYNGQKYKAIITSNAKQFNHFKFYTAVKTAKPIPDYVSKNSHVDLVGKKAINLDQLRTEE